MKLILSLASGFAGAWAAGRAMQSLLFGVGELDPGILLTTAAAMFAVVFCTTLLPTRRAARVNPLEALREE